MESPSNSPKESPNNTNTSTKSKKKVLIVHSGDVSKRIVYTDNTTSLALERSIRRECNIPEESFCMFDQDGDSVVLDGKMEPCEIWITTLDDVKAMSAPGKKKPAKKTSSKEGDQPVLPSKEDFEKCPEENALFYAFDPKALKWKQSQIKVRLIPTHFASGKFRRAHFLKISHDPDTLYVAKTSIEPEEDSEIYFQDAETQVYALQYAEQFNSYDPPKKVQFLEAHVIALNDRPNSPLWAVEKFIYGSYRKHNNNFGYVSEDERSTPQAFSHFTYEASSHSALICDIQGVGDLYTDPQMHTAKSIPTLGKGNLGQVGFEKFLTYHRCNSICRYLKLPEINAREGNEGTVPQNAVMAYNLQQTNIIVGKTGYNGYESEVPESHPPAESQRLLSEAQPILPNKTSSNSNILCCCIL